MTAADGRASLIDHPADHPIDPRGHDVREGRVASAGRGAPPKLDPAAFRKAGPGAFISSWKNVAWLLVALAALSYGWRVTQVDFVGLVVNLPKAERIATGLLRPDVLAQETEQTSVATGLQVGAAGSERSTAAVGSGTLNVTPGAVQPGGQLTVAVAGVQPDSDVSFFLVNPAGTAQPIRRNEKADQSGNASVTFALPAARRRWPRSAPER